MALRTRRFLAGALLSSALAWGPLLTPSAHADKVDDTGKNLTRYQSEAGRLMQGIQSPKQLRQAQASNIANRRLIDAQVQFGIGNYDESAILLYDFVEKYPNNRSFDEGLYYLGESLFQKGDNVASRTYFTRLVSEIGASSKFYQQGLERLIELSIRLRDPKGVDQLLATIDALPAGKRNSSIPYVRGKYAYYSDSYDDAIRFFAGVPANTEYDFQARFFRAAAHIAKGELSPASKLLLKLVSLKPKNKEDRRVVELAHMALGRLHYERDQPSKAIDRYLRISRKSDLFDEVLYEVAWVYVKNKEYSKALRALELLALADPTSSRMPEVRILEGNLRIRKAQAQSEKGLGNGSEEYDKALKLFQDTHDAFDKPSEELKRLIAEQADPTVFLAQITGREQEAFTVKPVLPEVAAAWLRDEPDVKRMVLIETDLEQIQSEVTESERTIVRLERAINSNARIDIFPELSERRYRATELLEAVDEARRVLLGELDKRARKVASGGDIAELNRLKAAREKLSKQLAEMPNSSQNYTERVMRAKKRYNDVDQESSRVQVVLDSTEAEIVAIEKFMSDLAKPVKDAAELKESLAAERTKIIAMRDELEALRRDATVAADAAGTGDEQAVRERDLRAELRAALSEEAAAQGRLVSKMTGGDAARAGKILAHLRTANAIMLDIGKVFDRINSVVDEALVEVRQTVADERAKLAAYRKEYDNYQIESNGIGSEVVGSAFSEVAKKFLDVLMKTDVGVVDVAWSHKEANERLRKRLVLDQARELRVLDADFADVINEVRREREAELRRQSGGGQ